MPTPEEFAEAQRARFEEELSDLLRIPSVGTLPAHREDMQRAAGWIADRLRRTGNDAANRQGRFGPGETARAGVGSAGQRSTFSRPIARTKDSRNRGSDGASAAGAGH